MSSGGSAKSGPNGLVIVCWWDSASNRYHACTGEVGIDGIKANTDYCVKDGKLAEVTP